MYKCKSKADCGSHFNDPHSAEPPLDQPSTCHCFGAFKAKHIWQYDKVKHYPQFDDAQITIVYKERVKVFYNRVSAGVADGYSDYNPKCFTNKNGYLYSFTGLRGDAKRLYQDIVKRKEKRVRLVRADTWELQQQYADEADYVILACGYQTAKVPIRGHDGKDVALEAKVPGTQFDVDNKFRLKMADGGSVCKVFGSGLAFPTRTSDGKTVPETGKVNPRADSFSLYLNYVGTKVLDSLLPKTKLLTKVLYVYNDRLGNKRKPANKPETQKLAKHKLEHQSPAPNKQHKHISKTRFRAKDGETVDHVKIPSSYMHCKCLLRRVADDCAYSFASGVALRQTARQEQHQGCLDDRAGAGVAAEGSDRQGQRHRSHVGDDQRRELETGSQTAGALRRHAADGRTQEQRAGQHEPQAAVVAPEDGVRRHAVLDAAQRRQKHREFEAQRRRDGAAGQGRRAAAGADQDI